MPKLLEPKHEIVDMNREYLKTPSGIIRGKAPSHVLLDAYDKSLAAHGPKSPNPAVAERVKMEFRLVKEWREEQKRLGKPIDIWE